MEGWIKIHRKIEDWEWASNPVMFYFWVKLLLIVNWEDKEWEGHLVERGSIMTSISKLASKLSLSPKQVRTCVDRLKKGKQIDVKTANKWTKITVCNYDDYQVFAETEGQTKGKQTGNQRATTKEDKKKEIYPPYISKDILSPLKGGTPLEDRQKSFYDSLIPFVAKYGREMIRDFYNYWSEPDRAAKPKMRFEKEKTWSLERRLETWNRNEAKFNSRTVKSKGERMWDTVKKNLAVLPFNEDGTINI